MEFTKAQLDILRKALHEYLVHGDWQDNEHADIVQILNKIGEERCK